MKTAITFILCFLLLAGFLFTFEIIFNQQEKDICDEFGVIYLKESEKQYGSSLADKENGIIVYPEINRIVARTEILECPIFNYKDHLKLPID